MAFSGPFKNIPHGQKRKRDFTSETPQRGADHKPSFAKHKQNEPNEATSRISTTRKQLLLSRAELPIWPHTSTIRRSLASDRHVLILVGETGSGKSTQVPQFLMSEPWCKRSIAVTEPRRVAATTLARRVAEEVGTPLGTSSPASKVGYSVRFDPNFAPGTKVKFLTEGMLLQEMLRDPWLRAYSVVIVDEVHERGVNVDLILGFLRKILAAQRKEKGKQDSWRKGAGALKVVVMSATADTEKLFRFFEEAFEPAKTLNSGLKSTKDTEKQINGPVNGPLITNSKFGTESTSTNDGARLEEQDNESESSWSGISSSEVSGNEGNDALVLELNGETKAISETTEEAKPQEINGEFCPSISTLYIEGRQHPVEIFYAPAPTQDFVEATLKTIFQVHLKEPLPGDILVFLTGQDVVESLESLVNEHAAGMGPEVPHILALPLFAALPPMAQQRVFQPTPPRTRKIILATNIAETSVTIPGVRFVIDCGLAKIKEFRAQLGLDSLLVKPISKSAAIQRKGRAGREAPGKCYRLYTEPDYLKLDAANTPEILRCDLAMSLLIMKARGVPDVVNFPYLDPPKREAMRKALAQLHRLDALDSTGAITPTGKRMAQLPLSPPLSRALIASATQGPDCVLDVIDIIASMTVENIFLPLNNHSTTNGNPAAKADDETSDIDAEDVTAAARRPLLNRRGDHLTLLAAVRAYAAEHTDRKAWCTARRISHRAMKAVLDVRKQLREQCKRQGLLPSTLSSTDALPSSLSSSHTEAIDKPTASGSTPNPNTEPQTDQSTNPLLPLLHAFLPNLARLHPDGAYRTLQHTNMTSTSKSTSSSSHQSQTQIQGQVVAIHPSSVLFGRHGAARPELVLYGELVYTSRCWMRQVSAVEWKWVAEVVAGLDGSGSSGSA